LRSQLLFLLLWPPRPTRLLLADGTSIKAAVPAVTTDVRYRVRRDYPTYNSYWGYPAYTWGYPNL
jgi:hypothetical protein